MIGQINVDLLWSEIWGSHWSFQKWLTPEQTDIAIEEMSEELQECIDRAERTFE